MRRMLMAVLASALLGLMLPALAAAHHGRHHARGHKHHASSARILHFGAKSAATGPSTSSPTTPSTSEESAGTVKSFDKETGLLTVELKDKSTFSGKVTEDTELRCVPATPPEEPEDEQEGGDDEGDQQSGDHQSGEHGSSESGEFAGQHGDSFAHAARAHSSSEGGQTESCTTSVLTPGAVVLSAELKLGSTGAVWDKLVIVH